MGNQNGPSERQNDPTVKPEYKQPEKQAPAQPGGGQRQQGQQRPEQGQRTPGQPNRTGQGDDRKMPGR